MNVKPGVVIVLALIALVGCGTPTGPRHEYSLVPGRAYNPVSSTLTKAVIIPLNETLDVPIGADVANDVLYRYLTEYVESKGVEVQSIDVVAYRKASGIAANEARKAMMNTTTGKTSATLEFSMMVPHLLAALELDVDMLIVPNTVLRTGEYSGGKMIKWDGVRRRERGAGGGGMTGNTSVASLHTMIFDSKGEQIFSGYGGLDVLFGVSMQKRKYVLKEDRLQDEDHLREGVCISVHPFFGQEEACYY